MEVKWVAFHADWVQAELSRERDDLRQCLRTLVLNHMWMHMLGCFNPNLGRIWTNPNVGLKMSFQIWTQLQLSLSTVHFFHFAFCPYLTQIWVETTQHFLERTVWTSVIIRPKTQQTNTASLLLTSHHIDMILSTITVYGHKGALFTYCTDLTYSIKTLSAHPNTTQDQTHTQLLGPSLFLLKASSLILYAFQLFHRLALFSEA